MQEILFEYEMHPTTWVYLSSLMIIGIYFKFHRLWSVRNLDLVVLIFFAPGLLLFTQGYERLGYVWLFTIGAFYLIRLLLDPIMVRRPLLEPNLSASGLTFTGVALLVFLMTNVITARQTSRDLEGVRRWEQIIAHRATQTEHDRFSQSGPDYPWFYSLADLSSRAFLPDDGSQLEPSRQAILRAATLRTTAILGHLAIAIGMVLIGYRHFDNLQTGVAAATLYLLVPYTSQMTGRVDHVIPAALLLWAVVAYRRPVVSGILAGLATGVIYYPLFLFPLWCGFYWHRGLFRFLIGAVGVMVLLALSLLFTADGLAHFAGQLQHWLGWTSQSVSGADGFWTLAGQSYHAYRYPVIATFVALCGSMALWPPQKNLGTLLSCSAAVMLATQFCHAHQGGLYMAWYLPLLVLTIFRPNLEDRVAISAVGDTWIPKLSTRWLTARTKKSR